MAMWTPTEIATALWLDATDASTITLVSSVVSQWNDKSGNNRNATQGTSGNRPAVNATGISSQPAINFSGSLKSLFVPRGFITNAVSAFIVWSGGSANGRMIDQRSTGGVGTVKGWTVKNYNTTLDLCIFDDGGGNYRSNNVTFTPTGGQLSSVLFPVGGGLEFYLNGASTGSNVNGGTTPTDVDNTSFNICIGGNAAVSATQDFTGLIGEIVLLSSSVSTETRQRMEGYLAHKWGLYANLPVSHPYRYAPPVSALFIQTRQPHNSHAIARLGL